LTVNVANLTIGYQVTIYNVCSKRLPHESIHARTRLVMVCRTL